ncbi:MAG: GntR family transcriptional regulator, partial [Desulfosporosinus sp.]|nr:GntR family transcriptional regulator [Desulfosporosinus sp.]
MFNTLSLREQVYQYLSHEIQAGELRPGASIRLDVLSKKLGISKTPLKEAILKLECEGFVEILPRRGIVVKKR